MRAIKPCQCSAVGPGVQLFRVRRPGKHFQAIVELEPQPEHMIGGRAVWKCRGCGALFALLRLPYKDEEDILVRGPSINWQAWNWNALASTADSCRWRGPELDERYVL